MMLHLHHLKNGLVALFISRICFYVLSFFIWAVNARFHKTTECHVEALLIKVIIFFFEIPFILIFLCLNAGVLVFNFWTIFACRFPKCGYIAGPLELYPYHIHNNLSKDPSPDLNQEYFDLHKLEFTMATLSGSLSYFIMMYILITLLLVQDTEIKNLESVNGSEALTRNTVTRNTVHLKRKTTILF